MTAKKDLKKRIRERASRTGESYTAARAQLRKVRIEQAPNATAEARAEGFHGEAVVSKKLRALGDLRPLFARLRQLLEALDAEACGPLFRGESALRRIPEMRDSVEARRFLLSEELGLGARGQMAKLSWNGRVVVAHLLLWRSPLLQLGLLDEVNQLPMDLLGIGR